MAATRIVGRLFLAGLLVVGCSSGATPTSTPGPAISPGLPTASPAAASATSDASATPAPEPTLSLPDLTDLGLTTALEIDASPSPDFIVLAGNAAFVSGVGKGIGRYDALTGALIDSVQVPGGSCEALDSGFGAAWTATCGGPGLARIDASTGELTTVTLEGQIPEPEASIGVGERAVWVIVRGSPPTLVRVDPTTMAVTGRFLIPGTPTAVRAGAGGVWVSDPTESVVHRIDPGSGAIVATIPVGRQPQFLAVGEGAVWTMNQVDGTVSRIDPGRGAVTATIRLGEPVHGGDIAVGGGYVWLRGSRTLLFKIDPRTNEVVARYGPSSGSGSVAADDRAVWITAHDILRIWRLEPDGVIE